MIDVLRPAFLWAGGSMAAAALLIHLLRPRERRRKPLPTVRFLTPDPRRRIRLRRRPDELLLLAVRVALALSLGAAFAGLRWVGPGGGTTTVVVIDASASAAAWWDSAGVLARAAPGPIELALVRPAPGGAAPRLERLGRDVPDAEGWRALAPRPVDGELRLAHLVRAARDVGASVTGADSLSARIVTRPRWTMWGPGVTELRRDLWPGRIELTPVGPADATADAGALDLSDAAVTIRAPEPLAPALAGAMETLGVALGDTGRVRVELRAGPPDVLGDLWDVAGAAVTESSTARLSFPAFLLLDGRVLDAAAAPPGGTPAPGTAVPLLRVGGRPAAAARTGPGTCDVALPAGAETPVAEAGDLVVLVEAVLRDGCRLRGRAGAEEAVRSLLEDDARPPRLPVQALPGREAGLALSRWLLALALVLGGLDVWLGARAEQRRRMDRDS